MARRRALVVALAAFALLQATATAQPDYGDQYDFTRQIDIGYSAPQGRISAPFNVSPDPLGTSYLHYFEANSTNGGPFTIRMYAGEQYDELYEANNTGRELVIAERVTYFLFDFSELEVTTTPTANHTAASDIVDNFADLGRSATGGGYFVVVENREIAASSVFVGIDRDSVAFSLDFFGVGPAGSIAALGGIVLVLVVVPLYLLRRRRARRNAPGEKEN